MRQGNSARWATGNEDLGAEVDAHLRSFVRASEMRLDAEVEATDAGWPPQEMPDGFEFGLGEESQPASESHTRRVLHAGSKRPQERDQCLLILGRQI